MILAGTNSGIIVTIVTFAATILVFVLAKVASTLKRAGGFDVVLKPIGLLDSQELRFNLSFENGSKKDLVLNNLCLSYFLNGAVMPICQMSDRPLARGFDDGFVTGKNGHYGFFVEAGKSQSAVVSYLLPSSFALPEGAKLCLSCEDESKRTLYALIDLKDANPRLLSFKRLRSKA